MDRPWVVWKAHIPQPWIEMRPVVMLAGEGARALHMGLQQGEVRLWYLCSPRAPLVPYQLEWVATGQEFEPGDGVAHVGTLNIDSPMNPLVFHLFSRGPVTR